MTQKIVFILCVKNRIFMSHIFLLQKILFKKIKAKIIDINKRKKTYIDLYIFSPFGPICWFCKRVLTKSNGKTHDTPIIPAIPPFIIFGINLLKINRKRIIIFILKKNTKNP